MSASLWSRRRMSLRGAAASHLVPPTALTIKDSNTACPSLSLQTASSPPFSPRTPTLLVDHRPISPRAEVATTNSPWGDCTFLAAPVRLEVHPSWLAATDHTMDRKIAMPSTAQHKTDLRIEIDMAALATEMALYTLDSDSDASVDSFTCDVDERVPARWDSRQRPSRQRLLPDFAHTAPDDDNDLADAQRIARDRNSEVMPSLSSGTTLTDTPSYGSLSPNTPFPLGASQHEGIAGGGNTGSRPSVSQVDAVDIDDNDDEKPVRKGRARMSQEKRRRLARRREREAMMLGLPPRSASAPAHQTSFVGFQTLQRDNCTVPLRVMTTPGESLHPGGTFVRSASTPQLSVVDCSHSSVTRSSSASPTKMRDHLCPPPSETALGMVRRASAPNAMQLSGSNHPWRGATRDAKQRPLLHHHHQEHPTRSVSLSDSRPTITARAPVFGSWPSLLDAQSVSSWRKRAGTCQDACPL